jgi:hypothetical protein
MNMHFELIAPPYNEVMAWSRLRRKKSDYSLLVTERSSKQRWIGTKDPKERDLPPKPKWMRWRTKACGAI